MHLNKVRELYARIYTMVLSLSTSEDSKRILVVKEFNDLHVFCFSLVTITFTFEKI